MRELQAEHPTLSWKEANDMEVASLLSQVASGTLDAAVVFEHQFRLNRLFFPEVEDGFRLGKPLSLAWAFPAGQGLGLVRELIASSPTCRTTACSSSSRRAISVATIISNTSARALSLLMPRSDCRTTRHSSASPLAIPALTGSCWPQWLPGIPLGSRGHLPHRRARPHDADPPDRQRSGVENRLDPAQSIEGGARYLRSLEQRLPESITGDDRLYMALAAYNVGLGHLYDARDITLQRGGDPDAWKDVRRSLPLLQESGWHEQTRHGYARGGEPVIYVRNIRRYHEILAYVDRSQEQFHPLNARLPEKAGREAFDVVPPST